MFKVIGKRTLETNDPHEALSFAVAECELPTVVSVYREGVKIALVTKDSRNDSGVRYITNALTLSDAFYGPLPEEI